MQDFATVVVFLAIGGFVLMLILKTKPDTGWEERQHRASVAKKARAALPNRNVVYRCCVRCDGYVEPFGYGNAGFAFLKGGLLGALAAGVPTHGKCINCDAIYDKTNFPLLKNKAVAR